MAKLRYEIDKAVNGQWFFRVRAANWRELARSSETYWNRDDAINAANLLRTDGGDSDFVDVTAA